MTKLTALTFAGLLFSTSVYPATANKTQITVTAGNYEPFFHRNDSTLILPGYAKTTCYGSGSIGYESMIQIVVPKAWQFGLVGGWIITCLRWDSGCEWS